MALANVMEQAEAAIGGRAAVPVTEAPFYTPEKRPGSELSESMLAYDLPARRKFIQLETSALGKVRETAAPMLDAKTPEGQVFAAFLAEYPEFRGFPAWPLIVRDLTTGYLANKPKAAKPRRSPRPPRPNPRR